jgi:hypothetical protein
MIDLNDPSPLLMTTFEKCGFFPAVIALVLTIAWDVWRGRWRRP